MAVAFSGFCGPTNRDLNPIADVERTINWYPHKIDAGTPKLSGWNLVHTPGVRPYVTLGSGPIRAVWSQDNRCFAVAGVLFYEVFGSRTATLRGTVAEDGNPATISSNGAADGHQLFVTSGGLGYIYDLDADTLTEITDVNFPDRCSMGTFSTSYFIALKAQSNQFNYSALLDGTDWGGLDIARTSYTTDNKLALIANHAELWLFGSQRTEIWQNTGDVNIPFQPIPGTVIEAGITAMWSAQRIDNTIMWLGGDERGNNIVWAANGYTPTRVSTFSIETTLNSLQTTANAIAWTYQQAGHAFYVLYLPANDTYLVYDVATGQWHERALWNDERIAWEPHVALHHTQVPAWNVHLVGDRRVGILYELRLDQYEDEIAVVR